MPNTKKRTFSLPSSQMSFIDAKVQAGDYASATEVVRAGLRALKERDAAVERWLLEDVAPVYDAMKADPSRAAFVDNAFNDLRARHAERVKAGS
jgi:antitoxin ParD1/3/4